jgi:hypothetical protein
MGGELLRVEGSRLDALGLGTVCFCAAGITGTGGVAVASVEVAAGRGEGVRRRVLSDMDGDLCSARFRRCGVGTLLPLTEASERLLCMRFVCTSPTWVGDGGWLLSAVAAAAEDREALRLFRKAREAAEVAAELGGLWD